MPANLRQLTAFRILAAAWVVAFHYWSDVVGGPPPALVAKGYLGVEAFFVLSGFILSHVYLDEAGRAGGLRYGAFLGARLARIYPTHLFTLAAMAGMAGVAAALGSPSDHGVIDPAALPANLTLTQAWGLAPSAAFNHPSWSISAEWAAYILFPLFAAAAWRLRGRPVAAVAGALALLWIGYGLFGRLAGFPLTEATIAWGALRILPPFAYGCALHLAWRAGTLRSAGEAAIAAAAFAGLTLACAALGAPDAATVAACGGLVLALAEMARRGARVLAAPVWVWLGEISFALYMVAIPWRAGLAGLAGKLGGLREGAPWPPLLSAALILGALAAAAAVHHGVERPARLWLRSLGRRRPYRPAEEFSLQCDNRPREAR